MTRLDHGTNNARAERSALRAEARYAEAKAAEENIYRRSQDKFRAIAVEHADSVPFCQSIAATDRPITKAQAAVLGRIEAKQRAEDRATSAAVSSLPAAATPTPTRAPNRKPRKPRDPSKSRRRRRLAQHS